MSNKQQISYDASMQPPKMSLNSITRTALQARRRAISAGDSSPESLRQCVQDFRAILQSDALSSLTIPEYRCPSLTADQRLHRILQDAISIANSALEDLDDDEE